MVHASADAATAQAPARRAKRPPSVNVTIALLSFLGITAVAGGIELTFGVWVATAFPTDWLDHVPLINSWLILV